MLLPQRRKPDAVGQNHSHAIPFQDIKCRSANLGVLESVWVANCFLKVIPGTTRSPVKPSRRKTIRKKEKTASTFEKRFTQNPLRMKLYQMVITPHRFGSNLAILWLRQNVSNEKLCCFQITINPGGD
jgi:hypothetical protein